MDSGSTNTVYNGKTPEKCQHYYSTNPPTAHHTDSESLRKHRLSAFNQSSSSTLLPSTSSPSDIQKSHNAKINSEMTVILARLNQQ
ncbi:hypothetical protein F4810DRAFT_36473 [Camillea tinctor]|nr:hypothetical protein F4810DRAFT_36473 [Camillea tinctor]